MVAAALGKLNGFFGGLGLKLPNISTRYKVGYYKTMGLYFMTSTKIGYEVDELRVRALRLDSKIHGFYISLLSR